MFWIKNILKQLNHVRTSTTKNSSTISNICNISQNTHKSHSFVLPKMIDVLKFIVSCDLTFFFRILKLCFFKYLPHTLKITVPKRPQIRLPPPPQKWPFFFFGGGGGKLFFWERARKFLFKGNILWGKSDPGLGWLADCTYPAGTIRAWILIFADLGHFYSHFLRSNLVLSNVCCQNDDSELNLAFYSLKFFWEVK